MPTVTGLSAQWFNKRKQIRDLPRQAVGYKCPYVLGPLSAAAAYLIKGAIVLMLILSPYSQHLASVEFGKTI